MMHLLFFIFFPIFIYADALSEGESIALSANQKSADIKQGGAEQLEIPLSERPKECEYYDPETLSQQAQAQKASEDYSHIKASYNKMDEEVVEPYDPFQGHQKTVQTREVKQTVEKVCEDGGDAFAQICTKHRVVHLRLVPEMRQTVRDCPGHKERRGLHMKHWSCSPGCRSRVVVSQSRSVTEISDRMVGCESLEGLDEKHNAEYDICISHYEQGPPEKRSVEAVSLPDAAGSVVKEQELIAKPFWEETYKYLMQPKKCVQCQAYLDAGCRLTASHCLREVKTVQGLKLCTKWRKTFSCEDVKTVTDDLSDFKSSNLIKPISSTPNQNMYKALAQLEELKQVAKHMEGNPVASIFKGDDARCSINFGGAFKNCCRKDGGWGVNAGVGTKCSADEETLKRAKHDKRCVYIGTRVKKKVAGVVLSKEQVHCCFPSKIARAIQKGARRQLGLNFGSADAPNCRGLTPGELERVDFSSIDLRDAYSDIALSANKVKHELKRDFEKKQRSLNTKETSVRYNHEQLSRGYINAKEE